MANTEPQYFFLHIPKCAGTAVLKSLSRIGKKRYLILSESPQSKSQALKDAEAHIASRRQKPEDIDLVLGHDVFLGLDQIAERPAFYFTFLRDPVARYISHYRFLVDCANDKRHPIHAFAQTRIQPKGETLSLAQYVATGDYANLMSHYLAAANHPDLASKRWEVQEPDELKMLAMAALEKMSFVGTVETSADDLAVLCKHLNLKVETPVVNRSKTQVVGQIDADILTKIRKINATDQCVYERALELRQRQ